MPSSTNSPPGDDGSFDPSWFDDLGFPDNPSDEFNAVGAAGTTVTVDGRILPRVRTPGTHAHLPSDIVVPEHVFVDEFLQRIPPDALYRREKFLGRIIGPRGARIFEPLDPQELTVFASHHLVLWKTFWVKNEIKGRVQGINKNLVRLVNAGALRNEGIRDLKRICSYPTFSGSEFRVTRPGWNAKPGVYFDATDNLRDLEPLLIGDDEASRTAIRDELIDLIFDFPFDSPASAENFIGLLLTPIIRPALEGHVPIHAIDCPQERTGKTYLCESVLGGTILNGPLPVMQFGADDVENEKRITALLLEGSTLIHFDNVNTSINSGSLASLVTSHVWSGRLLGKSRIVRLLNNSIVLVSGNNLTGSSEVIKRIVPIRLMPLDGKPEMRSNFKHPDIAAHAKRLRPQTLSILLGMVETWKRAGCPRAKIAFGGFNEWAGVVGGVLNMFGFTSWLENREEWVDRADGVTPHLAEFVAEWLKRYGVGKRVRAGSLVLLIAENPAFDDVNSRSKDCRAGRLGRRLTSLRDRTFGDVIVRSGQSGNGTAYWLESVAPRNDVEVSGGRKPPTHRLPIEKGQEG